MNSEYEYVDKRNQEVVRDLKATFFDILCRLEEFSSFLEQKILEESEESKREQLQAILDSQDGCSDQFMQQVHILTDFIQQFDFSLKRYSDLENVDNDISVDNLKEVVPDTIDSNIVEGDATLLDSETTIQAEASAEDENSSDSSEKSENAEEDENDSDSSEESGNAEEDESSSDSSEESGNAEEDENDSDSSEEPGNAEEDENSSDSSEESETGAGDGNEKDTNLVDTVTDSSDDGNSSSDSLNDNDVGKSNDDSSSLETQDNTDSTMVSDASNLNLDSNDTAPLESSNTLVDSNTDANSTVVVPNVSNPGASASVDTPSPVLPVQESASVPVQTQPLSVSLPIINTAAPTGSVSESNTLILEPPVVSSTIDDSSDMPLPDIPIMRQMQNAESYAKENGNSAVIQNNMSNISHSFQKANTNLAKAILVTNTQYQKLLGSKDIQSNSLFPEKGGQPALSQNISIEERRKQIEAMMEQANNLYKQGQTKEAQAMYDVISAMNQDLQQAN